MIDIYKTSDEPNLYENKQEHADTAVLMIHGYMGDPCQFDALAHRLHEADYKLYALRLPGHGGNVKTFVSSRRCNWEQAVLDTVKKLRPRHGRLILCGHSMGGLLSILAADEVKIDGLILLSSPLLTRITLCSIRMSLLTLLDRLDENDPYLMASRRCSGVTFDSFLDGIRTIPRFFDLLWLTYKVRAHLGAIQCPTLIIQSKKDETVHPMSAKMLHKRLGGDSRILWLKDSRHFYHTAEEEKKVLLTITQFIHTICSN